MYNHPTTQAYLTDLHTHASRMMRLTLLVVSVHEQACSCHEPHGRRSPKQTCSVATCSYGMLLTWFVN